MLNPHLETGGNSREQPPLPPAYGPASLGRDGKGLPREGLQTSGECLDLPCSQTPAWWWPPLGAGAGRYGPPFSPGTQTGRSVIRVTCPAASGGDNAEAQQPAVICPKCWSCLAAKQPVDASLMLRNHFLKKKEGKLLKKSPLTREVVLPTLQIQWPLNPHPSVTAGNLLTSKRARGGIQINITDSGNKAGAGSPLFPRGKKESRKNFKIFLFN